jgi:hypothetical protein
VIVLNSSIECRLIPAEGAHRLLEAMVEMVLDQSSLGVDDRFFDCRELLRNVEARPPALDHAYDALQVSLGAFQPLDDLGMGGVRVRFGHRVHFQMLRRA